MKSIKNLKCVTNIHKNWQPSDIAFIKKFSWSIDGLSVIFYCQLRAGVDGWPDTSKHFFEVSMLFHNVSSLEINSIGNTFLQISGFDIVDISSNGWERINFQVADYEIGRIKFFCEEVEIKSVSNHESVIA